MNKQEVFNKVVTHLRKQKIPARSDGNCVYRSADGLMCAVGCLIPDNLYDPGIEGQVVAGVIADFPKVAESLGIESMNDEDFLHQLQIVHDEFIVTRWEEQWKIVALQFNLQMPVDCETV